MNVGFFLLATNPDKSYVGSMLVTDEEGLPIEYKLTSSINPTAIQRALYGASLEKHIAINLCGTKLFNEIQQKPDVIFVKQEYCILLNVVIEEVTVICIKRNYVVQSESVSSIDY